MRWFAAVAVAGQSVQASAPAAEYLFAPQAVQAEVVPGFAPVPIVEYELAGQLTQAALAAVE
jgi:hypothetical protein